MQYLGGKSKTRNQITAQPQLLKIALNEKDIVYTPEWVASDMVKFFNPSGRILDPLQR